MVIDTFFDVIIVRGFPSYFYDLRIHFIYTIKSMDNVTYCILIEINLLQSLYIEMKQTMNIYEQSNIFNIN